MLWTQAARFPPLEIWREHNLHRTLFFPRDFNVFLSSSGPPHGLTSDEACSSWICLSSFPPSCALCLYVTLHSQLNLNRMSCQNCSIVSLGTKALLSYTISHHLRQSWVCSVDWRNVLLLSEPLSSWSFPLPLLWGTDHQVRRATWGTFIN